MKKTHYWIAGVLSVGLSIGLTVATGERINPINNRLTGATILLSALGFLALGVLAVSYADRVLAALSGVGQLIGALPGIVVAILTVQQPEKLTDIGRLSLAVTDPLLLPIKYVGLSPGYLTPIYNSHSSRDALASAWILANCTNIALWGSLGFLLGMFIRWLASRRASSV